MKRSYTLSLSYFLIGIAALVSVSTIKAQSDACDDISGDVTSAVQKDPSKVLMIVEDALVINEACSCEIVKAAITASHADAVLTNQIVQTAMSVAPKMSGIIMDCATSVSPGALAVSSEQLTATATSGKDVKNPLPLIEPPAATPEFAAPPHVIPVFLPPLLGGSPPRKRKSDPISPVQHHHCYP